MVRERKGECTRKMRSIQVNEIGESKVECKRKSVEIKWGRYSWAKVVHPLTLWDCDDRLWNHEFSVDCPVLVLPFVLQSITEVLVVHHLHTVNYLPSVRQGVCFLHHRHQLTFHSILWGTSRYILHWEALQETINIKF